MNLWHYTCTHARQQLGDVGKLLPTAQLVDPSKYGDWPAWRRYSLDLIWLTDMDVPDRAALGLTSMMLGCDRTFARYRVLGYRPIHYPDHRRELPKRLRDDLESAAGARPMHWWLAYTPVPVIYDPLGEHHEIHDLPEQDAAVTQAELRRLGERGEE